MIDWENLTHCYQPERTRAALIANEQDATLWRWFCALFEEGRLRWCRSGRGWLVSIDHKHMSTEENFDDAIRVAKARVEKIRKHKEVD
jgi:hypothetical protein